VQVRLLPEPSQGRAATGAVPRLENGWAFGPWGFDSLPFRWRHGRAAEGSALLTRRRATARRFESCCLARSGVVETERRATVDREAQVRALPPESSCPRGRTGDDAGPSTRKLRVRAPPGCSTKDWAVDGRPKGVTEQRLRLCGAWAVTCVRRREGGRAYLWRSTVVAGRRADRQRMAPEGVDQRSAPVEGR
jgi:hypothetical protein